MKCPNCDAVLKKADGIKCGKCGFPEAALPARVNAATVIPIESAVTDDERVAPYTGEHRELVVKAKPTKRPESVKMAVSIDATRSGLQFQRGILAILTLLLKGLEGLVSNLDIDLWTHGDEEYEEMPVQLTQSGTVEQAVAAAGLIQFNGGFDIEETHAKQIERLLDCTAWGSRVVFTRNILLMFMTGDSKPLESGKSMRQLGVEIKAKGVKLVLVCEETPQLRELVDAAGGYLIPISNNPDDGEIRKVAGMLCATLTIVINTGGQPGGTIPMSVME